MKKPKLVAVTKASRHVYRRRTAKPRLSFGRAIMPALKTGGQVLGVLMVVGSFIAARTHDLPGRVEAFITEPATYPASRFRIIDGDTVALGGERIRIRTIDTAETGRRAECQNERRHANAATTFARQQFARSRQVEVYRSGTDRYGRTLARLRLDGVDFGQTMIRAGHASAWMPGLKRWC
jgi:micrococcal nuclease